MIIYVIFKFLLSYFFVVKYGLIKNQDRLFLFVDLFVLLLYILHIYNNGFVVLYDVLFISLVFFTIFGLFKILAYLNNNSTKIINKLGFIFGQKLLTKIKVFFLKPIVCKFIYYLVWILPWNFSYYIYFLLTEHGWYFRVWFVSFRDVFFWKYFKWDSRDYFYELNWKIYKRYFDYIYDLFCEFLKAFYRFIYLLYILRKALLSVTIKKYLWIRFVVYIYLSMFYLYLLIEIQYLNIILFYLIILLEFCFLFFARQIIEYWEKEFILVWRRQGILTDDLLRLIRFFKNPLSFDYIRKWEINKFVWDKTLSNSITLNMLYKYILFVNKNTKGYFDKQMNIITRIHREKYEKEESVIWDILPATRYLIISLKNESFMHDTVIGLSPPDFTRFRAAYANLRVNKFFYLGFYEKTYYKTSLLMVIWMLRVNLEYWTIFFAAGLFPPTEVYSFYKLRKFHNSKITHASCLNLILVLYINKLDKRLIPTHIMLSHFFDNSLNYYAEEAYLYDNMENLNNNRTELPISDNFCGLSNYKKMFKIMSRLTRYQEETLTWNDQLQELLTQFYKTVNSQTIVRNTLIGLYDEIFLNVNITSRKKNYWAFSIRSYRARFELNIPEIFESDEFFYLVASFKSEGINIEVTKYILFEGISDEELLDIVYYYLLYSHKHFSEKQFFRYRGSDEKYYHFENDIDFSQIKDYKM